MARRKFTLWHSLAGVAALLLVEGAVLKALPMPQAGWLILAAAVLGSVVTLYVSTEIIEEVSGSLNMLTLLSAVVAEFVVFFAFEYWYLLMVEPASFPTLASEPVSLTLHSTMVFVFNPLYLPATGDGRVLLLINTLAALGLVLFILQNIRQFRSSNSS